jgi:uncharacterized protein
MNEVIKKVDTTRIILFCTIAFGLSWLIALWIQMNGGLIDSPEIFPGIKLIVLILIAYMATPALANVLTRIITKEGWKDTYLRPQIKKNWRVYLIAWFAPLILIAVGTIAFYILFPQYFDPTLARLENLISTTGVNLDDLGISLQLLLLINLMQSLIIAPIINAIPILGEEFGWRAYLLPKLMPLGSRKALTISGIIWGLWHAPIIAMGYNYGNYEGNAYFGAPWTGIIMMTIACIWLGIFLGWTTIKTKSVWPAVIGHASLNGLAAVSLIVSKGTPPLLIGPSAVGLLGGLGFILAAIYIWYKPNELEFNKELG